LTDDIYVTGGRFFLPAGKPDDVPHNFVDR